MTDPASRSENAAPAEEPLLAGLPQVQRLALAYAPSVMRLPTLALFALDTRLAGLLRHSREPMLAQLRLAWWREALSQDSVNWPQGEPLLAALKSWNGFHRPLVELVNGWEAITGPVPLPQSAIQIFADGRAQAFAALAGLTDGNNKERARVLGRGWALSDLAMRLGNPQEREIARNLALAHDPGRGRVSRPLRPLLVLHALSRRRMIREDEAAALSPQAVLLALRSGLLGF